MYERSHKKNQVFSKNHTLIQVLYEKNERMPKIVFSDWNTKPELEIAEVFHITEERFFQLMIFPRSMVRFSLPP